MTMKPKKEKATGQRAKREGKRTVTTAPASGKQPPRQREKKKP
ncbi:MAG: hypothetical protein PVI86_17590 [Phycisphaerae bacterium]|jgi:hypothetical protein